MRYSDLTETHYSDMMPKSFEDFRKRYMKLAKSGQTRDLYVQFTHNGSSMDRTSFLSPDHSDPVGIYGYPMDYVLKYPADIWYGRGARFLRVLEDTSKSKLYIDSVDDEWAAKRMLQRMGFSIPDIDEMIWRCKKLFRNSYGSVNVWAKTFLSCVQMDVLGFDMDLAKQDSSNYPAVRSGAAQTALFRKAGFDAIEDTSTNNKRAIINSREPEQIIFLTRGAFRIREVVSLRPDAHQNKLPSMTSSDPGAELIERPFAQKLAAIMGDKLREGPERSNLNGWSFYWTVGGRRIEIDFPMNPSYYENKKIGEKPHRQHKLADDHQVKISIKTELGDMKTSGDSNTRWDEILDDIKIDWQNLQANPQDVNWEPETLASFRKKEEDERKAVIWARMDAENEKLQQKIPAFNEDAKWVAEYYDLPYTPLDPTDPDARWAMRAIDRFSKIMSRKDIEQVLEFGDDDFTAPRTEKFQPFWRSVRAILEKMLPDTIDDPSNGYRIKYGGVDMFGSAREILERKLAA